jgi:hypothetical protein
MPRLVVGTETFEGLASEALYESEYEVLLQRQANLLFPDYHFIPFKVRVQSETSTNIPDAALIDPLYRVWWVVEVELAHHSLEGHVLPQVETFRTGRYGEAHAEHLERTNDQLDGHALRQMMRGAQPRVLVVVNLPRPCWAAPLRRYDALLAVAEVFRSDHNHYGLRLNGDYPQPPADILTQCQCDPVVRLLRVDSPASLPATGGGPLDIEWAGGMTEWVRVDIATMVYLSPRRGNPFPPGTTVALLRTDSGRLAFEVPPGEWRHRP